MPLLLHNRTPRLLAYGFMVLGGLSTLAWVYPEHRAIMLLAIQKLDGERRAILDHLWSDARSGYEHRLTENVIDAGQGEKPTQIDYAAWPAISGDHSCSPHNMLEAVLKSDWILDVADVTARLKRRIDEAQIPADRDNAMRDADLQLQRADPGYATRAGGNAVHYPVGRPSVDILPEDYFREFCFAEGSDMNAFGAYAWYHMSALLKAGRLARESLSPSDRSALSLAVLADEAYAIHFLQDLFASGHAAVTRGNSSLRKGTHDYYNEFGYETKLWNGQSVVLLGDVYMRAEDAELAAQAVKKSLEQVLDASVGKGLAANLEPHELVPAFADTMNSCKWWTMPARSVDPTIYSPLAEVIRLTPVPALGEGYGELPRFRAELGGFVGIAPAIEGGTIFGAFSRDEQTTGVLSSLEFCARFGVGLEGIMNKSSDGLAFLDLGIGLDSPSSTDIVDSEVAAAFGSVFAAIPSRVAIVTRIRLPFWLLPGDLLVAAPILLLTSPATLANMGVEATNGGLIPWQSRLFTSFGSFQFVLGREVSASFYGYLGDPDRFLFPDYEVPQLQLVDVKSIKFTFPVLEYRPFRSFSMDQSSSLVFQLYGGFDYPASAKVFVAGVEKRDPQARTYWFTGLRLSFDWRHYL